MTALYDVKNDFLENSDFPINYGKKKNNYTLRIGEIKFHTFRKLNCILFYYNKKKAY